MPGVIRTYLAAALAFGLAALPGTAQDVSLDLYTAAYEARATGDFEDAIDRIQSAIWDLPEAGSEAELELTELLIDTLLAADQPFEAGEALLDKATLLSELWGADNPDLTSVYLAAASAFGAGAAPEDAALALRDALAVERLYVACESPALSALYRQLAEAEAAAGNTEAAEEARDLAADPACAESGQSRGETEAGGMVEIEVHYATDRQPTGSGRLESYYGTQRGALEFGKLVVSIPPGHKAGQIESAGRFGDPRDASRFIVIQSISPTESRAVFFDDLQAALGPREDGRNEILIFIHGFSVSFASAAKRTAQMAYDLNFDGVPMLYSWPSRESKGLFAYVADTASVQVSARRLRHFLEEVRSAAGDARIHIIAHSMGNRALTEALEHIALAHPETEPLFDQVIFAAPDVDAQLFSLQAETIAPLAKRLTLYTSNGDLALSISRRLHGGAPRAGLGGEAVFVSDAVDSVDMSLVGNDFLGHTYYADDGAALTDILWLFWANPPPPERCGMLETPRDKGFYWIYEAENCDGGALLSALTLAREEGDGAIPTAEAKIADLTTKLAAEPELEPQLNEWKAIRRALTQVIK